MRSPGAVYGAIWFGWLFGTGFCFAPGTWNVLGVLILGLPVAIAAEDAYRATRLGARSRAAVAILHAALGLFFFVLYLLPRLGQPSDLTRRHFTQARQAEWVIEDDHEDLPTLDELREDVRRGASPSGRRRWPLVAGQPMPLLAVPAHSELPRADDPPRPADAPQHWVLKGGSWQPDALYYDLGRNRRRYVLYCVWREGGELHVYKAH